MSVWTTPTTRSTGLLVTAAIWNTDIVENLKYLKTSPVFDGSPVVDGPAIGIGVTPSGWGTINDLGAVQITGGALWATGSSEISVGQNYYYNGMLTLYRTSAAASEYKQSAGVHTWSTASSGTAGNSFSFTERMRLDASGNLGLGVSPGSVKLDIVGSINAVRVGDNTTNSTTKQGKWLNRHYTNTEEDLMFAYTYCTSTENGVVIGGGSGDQNAATLISFYTAANTTTVSGTERLRINSSGNVGIGTSSPAYRLDVNGSGQIASTILQEASAFLSNSGNTMIGYAAGFSGYTNGTLILQPRSSTGTPIVFATGSTTASERVRINEVGEVLVGYTTDQGAYLLQVNSQIFATNATIATSDGRFKTDVQPVREGLAAVNALQPVQFKWKKHPVHNFIDGTDVGFIAQDVRAALTGRDYTGAVVTQNGSGDSEFLGMADSKLIPLLVAAVQELSAEVNALKAH